MLLLRQHGQRHQHDEVYKTNSGATEAYTYGNDRTSRNNYWIEARDVTHNEMSYYLYDGRGSVTGNTWYNGMVTDVYQYDPYGKVTLGSTEHTEFYGYNAESYNPNTGLEYLRARYYNPNKGRFFQEDSYLGNITDPLTLNRYAYTKNSPLNYIDPSGHYVSVYKIGSGYSLIPDDKIENMIIAMVGFKPYGDSIVQEILEYQMNMAVEDFEYLDESSVTIKFISDLSTVGTTVSLMTKALELPQIEAVANVISTTATTIKFVDTIFNESPYISQITYFMFKEYLLVVNTKENSINRYHAFYSYVETLINLDVLTYETFLCHVLEDSITIMNEERYMQITKNLGFSIENILKKYSWESKLCY